jgi:hypothetical protein
VSHDNGAEFDLGGFIRACIESAGGAVEAATTGRLDAVLPPDLEAAAGGRSWVSLALTNDIADDSVEMATLGSPFVDALVAFACARGALAEGHLPGGQLKRKGLKAEAERTLLFSNCRTRYFDNEITMMQAATMQFDFKVAFVSEERRERIYSVPVNGVSGHFDAALAARLNELPISDESDVALPSAPRVSVPTAYEAARHALSQMVEADAARQQQRVRRRFAVELARTRDYYAGVIQSLERRRNRERRNAAGPGSGIAGLERKIAAAREERERKLRELGDSYGIRTRARLASVRLLWRPKVFFRLTIERGTAVRSLTLVYDGLTERLELPACDACRKPAARLRATSSAQLLCPDCVIEGS